MSSLLRGRVGAWAVTTALITHVLLFINWQWGGLRFTNARLNALTLVLGMLLPALVYPWIAARLLAPARSKARLCLVFLLAPLALASLLSSLVITWVTFPTEIRKNRDADLHLLRSVKVDGPPVRVYLADGVFDFLFVGSIIIQQERPLMRGLIWVTVLHTELIANEAEITVLDGHHIRCTFPPCDHRPETDVMVLRTR